MKVMAKMFGRDSIVSSIRALAPETQDEAKLAIKEGLLAIRNAAVKSILAHKSKGRKYKHGNVEHTASKPGFPPNSDTGRLAQSITWNFDEKSLSGVVGTYLGYGAILELSPTRARPWLKPAFDANIDRIISQFEKAILRGLKKATKK